jgi:hypothetical protein
LRPSRGRWVKECGWASADASRKATGRAELGDSYRRNARLHLSSDYPRP